MNPLKIARNLRDEYLKLLRTTFHPRQADLAEAFAREIERDGFLTREPFLALAQPYPIAEPLTELLSETRRRFGRIAETPYLHQALGCQRIHAGKPTVLATGTGSGKTEAFLMPVIDHCLRTRKSDEHAVKAILVYPMNALANDQCDRIRKILHDSSVSFGRYTRETKMLGKRPTDAPTNERILRTEFRSEPPDLLLTNYMMLEYMLMRGDGRDIFKNHQVRFIVLDEVHTYHGLLGTDVACLLRRLREALRRGNPASEPIFVGTSATLQAGEEDDPRLGVARFFSRLTGCETPVEAIITESTDAPRAPVGVRLPSPPEFTEEELDAFDPSNADIVVRTIRKLVGASETDARTPRQLWESAALPYLLLGWLRQPLSEDEVIRRLAAQPERVGTSVEMLRREVQAALLAGPCLPEDCRVRLRPRVHRLLRGLARFWRCTSSRCGKLLGEGIEQCDACGCRALPLALCRTCGWDFFMARDRGEGVGPWPHRVSDKSTWFLYDPVEEQIAVEAEEEEIGEEEENAEERVVEPEPTRAETWLDPRTLRLADRPEAFAPGGPPPRPMCIHVGRGTRCPVCTSRYGRFDILTPVSLGNSSALAHVARVLLRGLPRDQQKLLVFCDSRQDAAHQARFIRGVEEHLRLRRFVCTALRTETEPHDFVWLVDAVYAGMIREGLLTASRSKDEQKRQRAGIEGGLLTEFAIAPRVRAGLERLALVRVTCAGLDEALAGETFADLCVTHELDLATAAYAVRVLLDEIRQRRALSHEVLRRRLRPRDALANRYKLTVNRHVGLPAAFVPPGTKSSRGGAYELLPTWNEKGAPAAVQRLWKQLLGDKASSDALGAVLQWLQTERYLVWGKVGDDRDQGEGWQVNLEMLEFEVGRSFLRCSVCDKMAAGLPSGLLCFRAGCRGTLRPWAGAVAEGNLNALMVVENYAPMLYPEEHSAAVPDEKRESVEKGFMEGDPPRPNVLACTPTLEMGVNIGDLEAVAMRNVPPGPANYAQRSGRTGRISRMGIVAGFSRNTPHDGYFFDHPNEIIAGAIPPPRFTLNNREAVARHVRSLVLEHAGIDLPANLEKYLGERGDLQVKALGELLKKIKAAAAAAVETAGRLWADLSCLDAAFFEAITSAFPDAVKATIEERGRLIHRAAEEVRALGERVKLSAREEQAQKGYRELARRLREDNQYAYLPRVLAEAGLLPGYAFPADPGSVALGLDPQPIFSSRLQAQREFSPGQVLYARGGRWRVGGVALHRPGSSRSSGPLMFSFTMCGSCGLANNPKLDFCTRCSAPMGDATGAGLVTYTAWDAGAFQAWEAEVAAETEEERQVRGYDVRPHPQLDSDGQRYRVGPWALDLRPQEEIWFINHGPRESGSDGAPGRSEGFKLCRVCGHHFSDAELQRTVPATKDEPKDPRLTQTTHEKKCAGKPEAFALGHQVRADTLRLSVPGLRERGAEGVSWAWSFLYAIVQGAIRLFEIDEDDLEAFVLTKTVSGAEGRESEETLDVMWIDRVTGGAGTLERLAMNLPRIAEAALRHLEGHDCPSACYRCLKSFRNQRLHSKLDWRIVVPALRGLLDQEVMVEGPVHGTEPPAPTCGPEWDAARVEGCESPQEHRLLLALRAAGLPEPLKQLEVCDGDRVLTRADFAWTDGEPKLLVYVDGLQWHSTPRQRAHDNRVTNRLQTLGYRVLRFLGTQVHHRVQECVEQIRDARGATLAEEPSLTTPVPVYEWRDLAGTTAEPRGFAPVPEGIASPSELFAVRYPRMDLTALVEPGGLLYFRPTKIGEPRPSRGTVVLVRHPELRGPGVEGVAVGSYRASPRAEDATGRRFVLLTLLPCPATAASAPTTLELPQEEWDTFQPHAVLVRHENMHLPE